MNVDPDGRDGWIYDDAKNPWRYKRDDQSVIEIQLQRSDLITLIDADRHVEIKMRRWSALKPSQPTSHVQASWKEDGVGKHALLHVLLFPNMQRPRDHINRNPLDNRAVNIRCGANGINERNMALKSGGVYPYATGYRACWTDFHGVHDSKYFPWSNYESKEAARAAAEAHRKSETDRATTLIMAEQAKHGGRAPIEKRTRPPRVNNTGLKNITFFRKGTPLAGVQVQLKINKVKFAKAWTLSHYGTTQEVLDMAVAWRDKTKADNPQLPRKKRKVVVE
jgi:hypothetical protein